MSHMRSYLILQKYPACPVRVNWSVLEIRGKWLYSFCFVGCCFQELLTIASRLLQNAMSYISWTSCITAGTDVANPLSPPVSIVHHSREVFQAISGILFCLRWHGGLCHLLLVPGYVAKIWIERLNFSEAQCHMDVVGVRNSLWGVSSATFLCQLKTGIFH